MSKMVIPKEKEEERGVGVGVGERGSVMLGQVNNNSGSVKEYVTTESNRILKATYPNKPKIIKTTLISASTVLLISFFTLCITKPSFVCETADVYEPREHRRLIIGTAAIVSTILFLTVLAAGGTQYFKSSV